jgi:hypothetical protein
MQRMRHLIVALLPRMSMGTRETESSLLWIGASDLPASPGAQSDVNVSVSFDAPTRDATVSGRGFAECGR